MQLNLLSILVANHFGVLMRVTTIFSRRAFNIKSLTVAETENPEVSRITILMEGAAAAAKQVEKLLQKQEDVIDAITLPVPEFISRELLIIKVRNTGDLHQRLLRALSHRRNLTILETKNDYCTLEMTGEVEEVAEFVAKMQEYGIIEICRTGVAAISAGGQTVFDMK